MLILVECLSEGAMATFPKQHQPGVELHASSEAWFGRTVLCYANIHCCYSFHTSIVMVEYLSNTRVDHIM